MYRNTKKYQRETMRFFILYLFFILSWLHASDIDAQIAKIQKASPAERYKLVNQLKEQIAHLNALEQARSIAKYQESSLGAQQQAIHANQLSIEETSRKEQTHDLFVPKTKILPKLNPTYPNSKPKINPMPNKPEIPIPTPDKPTDKVPLPQPSYEKPDYQAPLPQYEAPTPKPNYDEPKYQAPTPQPEAPIEEPHYDAATPKPPASSPKPSYDKPTYPIPSSKRGGF